MNDDENRDEGISARTEDYYEVFASQEEIYLEKVDEQLDRAAEELITGDSDDAPLSEEAISELRRMTLHARRSDGCDW